jgi:tetratricopeptide (TPR) repeat protein
MKLRVAGLVFTALTFALASPALAQGDNALKQAQDFFDQAQVEYLQGKFDEAAEKFKQAHAARAFPQFLYNIGACYHMKGKKASDKKSYELAVDFYKRYLTDDPQAPDKAKIEKTIGVLQGEIQRLGTSPPDPANPTAPPNTPSTEVQNLGDVKVRGLVVIESEPQGATIYLDDKKKGPWGTTPWSGTLEGEHLVIVEKRGHKVSESRIAGDPSKLFVLRAVMAQEFHLGWLEVKSNVPKADVFLDDKNVGAVGQTPWSGNVKPGKHTVYVTAEGYDEVAKEVDVVAGEAQDVQIDLKGSPVGYLNLRGAGIEDSTIYVDGQILCERGPCRKGVREGTHTVTVSRPGYKSYSRTFEVQARTETSIKVALARKPSRTDAIVGYAMTGLFLGGGIYLGLQANGLRDELDKEIMEGNPPPTPDDPRFTRGKIFAIAADGAFAIGAVAGLISLYYTFREKGPPSTAIIDVNALASRQRERDSKLEAKVMPVIGPDTAGLGLEVRW